MCLQSAVSIIKRLLLVFEETGFVENQEWLKWPHTNVHKNWANFLHTILDT